MLQHVVDHIADAATVHSGNMVRLAHAQGSKIRFGLLGIHPVYLVQHQVIGLTLFTQVQGNHLVGGGQAGLGIHQEQHHIGLVNGGQGLLGHGRINALLVA